MPTSAMTALATLTLGSAQATVTFSSISQAYRDLRAVIQASGTAGPITTNAQVNGDTASNYNNVEMAGNGSSAVSATITTNNFNNQYIYLDTTAGSAVLIWDFLDYSVTDKHKLVLRRSNNSSYAATLFVGRWANTAAITTITFNASSFAAGSTFTLYGVSA